MVIAIGVTRFFQLAFSVIVLGLSITAVRWQYFGSAPAASGYAAFAGAWGTLTALVGIVAIFVASLSGIIMVGADILSFIILVAGGITYAVKIGNINCNAADNDDTRFDSNSPYWNELMNGGRNNEGYTGFPNREYNVLKSRCNTTRADAAFLFLACFASLVAAVLVFLAHRRGGTSRSAV